MLPPGSTTPPPGRVILPSGFEIDGPFGLTLPSSPVPVLPSCPGYVIVPSGLTISPPGR